MAIWTQAWNRSSAPSSLATNFGAASGVVIAGVLLAWIALKLDVKPVEVPVADTMLPAETDTSSPMTASATSPGDTLIEQAEMAFAAGRVVEPDYDNALGYYLAALEADPKNEAALAGLDRVVAYLSNQVEEAIFRSDWDSARAYAELIFKVHKGDEQARALKTRVDRLARIQELSAKAVTQFADGQLVTPKDDNAVESYKAILALDPKNEIALQGMRSIVQRLVASAQSAAFASDSDRAARYVAQIKSIDPKAPGLAEVEQTMKQMQRVNDDRSVRNDLVAASQALEADRLMPPAQPNAFDLFSGVLAKQPRSEAALRGIELVREAIIERIRSQVAAGAIDGMEAALTDARKAGVDAKVLAALESDARQSVRIAKSRTGQFDRIYPITELKVVRQVSPTYPRSLENSGQDGYVQVEFTVTEVGEVRDAKVLESSSSQFDAAALSAVNRWRFQPVQEEGKPIPVRTRVRFNFKGQ
jgi:TonB family protein